MFGLARDYLLARWIGFGETLDPYFFVIAVQALVAGFLVSITSVGMIQAFARSDIGLSRSTIGRLAVASFVAVLVGTVVAIGGHATWLVAGALLCSVVPASASAALSARLVARHRQLAAVLPGALVGAIPIVVVVACGRSISLDQLVLVTLIAYLAESMVLSIICWLSADPRGGALWRALAPSTAFGLGGASLVAMVWQAVDLGVVRSLGSTSVSVYSLGARVPLGLAGVLMPALTNTFLPTISASVRDRPSLALHRASLTRQMQLAFGLGTACALVLIAAVPLSTIVFGGSAVSRDQAEEVFMVQAVLGAMLPVYLGGTVLVRYLQAAGEHRAVIRAGIQATVVNVLADITGGALFGVTGVAAASIVAYLVSSGYLWYVMRSIVREGQVGTQ